jgi:hypothetical protein
MGKVLGLLVLVCLAVWGCSRSATGEGDDPAGIYEMVRVNGAPLPSILEQRNGDKIEIFSAELVLNANRTYTDSVTWRVTEAGAVTFDRDGSTGTYSRAGEILTFQSAGSTHTGTLAGDTVVIIHTGNTTVYKRVQQL